MSRFVKLSPNQPELVCLNYLWCSVSRRSVTDPRDGRKVALKKMPNVFQNLVSCKRVFRELRMLCFFKHDNVMTGRWGRVVFVIWTKDWMFFDLFVSLQVLSALDILQPPQIDCFEEMYPFFMCEKTADQNQPSVCCHLSRSQHSLPFPASHLLPHTFCPTFSS